MAKGGNSLQAVLNRAKADGDAAPAQAPAIEPVDVSRKAPPSGRQGTKLIGGHFPPDVSKQLRIIADEEGTTVQSLDGKSTTLNPSHQNAPPKPPSARKTK